MEAREEWSKTVGIDPLAAHAGIDFEVNGNGTNLCSTRGGFKLIELRQIPNDRSEFVANDVATLAGEGAANYENPCVGAELARFDAFFDAGNPQPAGSCTDRGGCAQFERMTVGVGLDDRQQFNLRADEVG